MNRSPFHRMIAVPLPLKGEVGSTKKSAPFRGSCPKGAEGAIPWLFLAVCYLFVIGTYALCGAHNVDSDVASEMVLASLLNREGRLLTESWFYSTELRAVSPVPLYQLALALFPGNWHAARTLSLAVLLALCSASILYMARGAGMKAGAVYAASVILLPVSEVHRFLFSHGGFYTVYVVLAAVIIGLVLRAGVRPYGERFVLLAVLGLWGGLAGVRMPMIVGVPLFAACALAALARHGREIKSLRALCAFAQGRMLLASGVMLGAMFAGYLVNACVYAGHYRFETHLDTTITAPSLTLLLQQLGYIAGFFGGRQPAGLSASGLVQLAMLAVVGLMGLAALWLLLRRKEMHARERLLVSFTLCALALGVLLNVLMGKTDNPYAVGYYMMGVFALAMLPFLALEKLCVKRAWLRSAGMLALACVFLAQGVMFARNHIRTEISAHEEAAAWLTENGYEAGYASFWNGNVLTEASDGALEMYVYSGWQDAQLYDWLQETDHLEALPEGRVFVFVSGEEFYGKTVPAAQESHLVFASERWGSRIYAYDSAQEVDALQRAQGAKE